MGRFGLCSVFVFLMVKTTATQSTQPTDHQVCMLVPQKTHACFKSFEGKPINQLTARINCLQDLLWEITPDMSLNEKDQSALRNISSLLGAETIQEPFAMSMGGGIGGGMGGGMGASIGTGMGASIGAGMGASMGAARSLAANTMARQTTRRRTPNLYPPSGKRVRKEYRTLSRSERNRFHRALKRLYTDGYIELFAKIHAEAADKHHSGASFLPWHRVLLSIFEEILRRYDRRVSLPYWASTLDDAMGNPVNSILWTPEYMGNGEGTVTSGPAAFWLTAQGGLERDYGKRSALFKREQIQQVLSQCYLRNISRPTAESLNDLEFYHGGAHSWVGGDMGAFSTTGYDPMFYMHHAYVDYIWEQFRRRQRYNCGVEPTTDYPEVAAGNSNHPDEPMTGFRWFINRDGIASQWTDNWYRYEPEPKCPDCCRKCPSPAPIYCDRRRNVCVPRSKLLGGQGQLSGGFAAAMSISGARAQAGQRSRPKNRGREIDAPPGDGRTMATALRDAMGMAPQALQQQIQTFL